jgi:hypothetical protein
LYALAYLFTSAYDYFAARTGNVFKMKVVNCTVDDGNGEQLPIVGADGYGGGHVWPVHMYVRSGVRWIEICLANWNIQTTR